MSRARITAIVLALFIGANHIHQGNAMCIQPENEQTQHPMDALANSLSGALRYVHMHQPYMLNRIKAAGMTNVPPFDINSPVMLELRNAMAALTPKVDGLEVQL